ncbi:MAG: lysophospholipid acyltransferase family protein [Kiritimatiellia bacterium]
MSFLLPIRHRLEYAAVRSGLALVDWFPLRACPALAALFGDLVFLLALSRRRVAVANILNAKIAETPAQARRIARASFRHFALLAFESIKAQKLLTPATLANRMVIHMPSETRALFQDPARGVLAACGHLGNWEVMAQAFSFTKPVVAIAQPMKNPLVNRLIRRRSPDSRFSTIPKHEEDLMRLLTPLKEGSVLAIMIDQHAIKKPMIVDFFGQPACSHRSIALLHLVTRLPIVFASNRRIGPLRFELTFSEPLVFKASGDKDRDIHTILKALNERLEAAIREAPEQYMWGHRRWRPPTPPGPWQSRRPMQLRN